MADPVTGLTSEDRNVIRHSWTHLNDPQVKQQNADVLILKLFQEFPETLEFFPDFQKKSQLQLRRDSKLREHALKVLDLLDLVVKQLGDTEKLVTLLGDFSLAHIMRGVKHKHMENVRTMFVPYLRSVLGEREMRENVKKAWTQLLTALVAVYQRVESSDGNE